MGKFRSIDVCVVAAIFTCAQLSVFDAGAEESNRQVGRVARPPLMESLAPIDVSALSRRAIYGFVQGDPSARLAFPRRGGGDPTVYVDGLGLSDSAVCIELIRAQGGYRAKLEISVPKGTGRVEIPFDSSDEARRFMASEKPVGAEIAIRARPGNLSTCKDNAPLLISSLSRTTTGGAVHLAVGGAGKGLPVIRINRGIQRQCNEIGSMLGRPDFGANVFGFYCPVEFESPICKIDNTATVIWLEGNTVADQVDVNFRRNCIVR